MIGTDRSAPVLVLSQGQALRQSLSRDLTRVGFETIPAVSDDEAVRYFGALEPQLVVAPFSELGETGFIAQLAAGQSNNTTLVLIGDRPEQEALVSRRVVFVAAGSLSASQLTEKILLLLLGKKLELPADHSVDCLVGSLEHRPFLELLRDLVESGQSTHIHVNGHGDCWTRSGEVVAAHSSGIFGTKAFCRMARQQEGVFQVRRLDHQMEPNITQPWDELMTQAVNESLISLPDAGYRLALHVRDGFFDREYSPLEQQLLRLAQQGGTVQQALDLPSASDGLIADRLDALVRSGVLKLQAPHRPLRILTDSTADLPSSLSDKLGIVSLPLTVHFGDKVFRDRVDIQPRSFYRLLTRDSHHPHTNPPQESHFAQLFTQLSNESDVLAVHISKKMSKTFDIAMSAAKKSNVDAAAGKQLKIVDSRQVSIGLGLLALLAARLAAHSSDLDAVTRQVENISGKIQTLFAVDTLTYLERGGRINKARAWLGSLLKVRPILGLEDGAVVPIDRVRGGRAAYPRLVELLAQRIDPSRKVLLMVAHANAPQWADRLRVLLEEKFNCEVMQVAEIGPVVGTHTGPGTVGVTAYQPLPEELALLSLGD